MSVTETTRPANVAATPMDDSPAGPDSLNGHSCNDTQSPFVAEGQTSPQITGPPKPKGEAPAGTSSSHGQSHRDAHDASAVAASIPGGQSRRKAHGLTAAGESDPGQSAAKTESASTCTTLSADPLLALAADVLDDLEKVRIANENRLRQLTRSEEDSDGETRGFGLDEAHPDVARLAALVGMLGEAEHKAELNLGRLMRKHPLGPWVTSTKGLGEKQMARLIASIGDPYIRPEITREDGTVESSRPRLVSELWAYAGYHVIRTPVSSHPGSDTHSSFAAGGDQAGHLGQNIPDTHPFCAGVAPKRQRGQHANWSAAAKMRAHLVAVSCMKCMDSPYRKTYEDTREKYAEAIHQVPCVRCGPSGKPAPVGTALSDGHKHARALRAVAKAVLKDLWREARRLHEGDTGP
jgi:hypothetical protein